MSSTKSTSSKAQRREAARAEAAALRAAQQRRDRRSRMITVVALIVAVVMLATIAVWVVKSGNDNEADPSGFKAAPPTYSPTATSLAGVKAPEGARPDGGIPIGKTGKAGTDNGSDAVEVAFYFDYMCPGCGSLEAKHSEMLTEAREGGEVTLVLHPLAVVDRLSLKTMYSTRAASAAAYVADRAPQQFSAFHELMFANQPAENTKGLSDQRIQELAEQAGVPEDVAAGIGDGTAVTEFGDWVHAATNTASSTDSLKVEYPGEGRKFGTPTITIDGQRLDDWTRSGALEEAIAAAKK